MEERLIANTVVSTECAYNGAPCWEWIGKHIRGYGQINVHEAGRAVRKIAARVSYETFIGPIPDGMELDHLCRNVSCIHPNHLEPVTGTENLARRDAAA